MGTDFCYTNDPKRSQSIFRQCAQSQPPTFDDEPPPKKKKHIIPTFSLKRTMSELHFGGLPPPSSSPFLSSQSTSPSSTSCRNTLASCKKDTLDSVKVATQRFNLVPSLGHATSGFGRLAHSDNLCEHVE